MLALTNRTGERRKRFQDSKLNELASHVVKKQTHAHVLEQANKFT